MVKNVVKLLFQAMVFLMTYLPTNVSLTSFFIVETTFFLSIFFENKYFSKRSKVCWKASLSASFCNPQTFFSQLSTRFWKGVLPGPSKIKVHWPFCNNWNLEVNVIFHMEKIDFWWSTTASVQTKVGPTLSPNLKTIGPLWRMICSFKIITWGFHCLLLLKCLGTVSGV